MRGARAAALLAVLLAGGCELAEVATPEGSDLLVVEAVLQAGASQQQVLLHRSLTGLAVRGEPEARVTLTSARGDSVQLEELPSPGPCIETFSLVGGADSLAVEPTCYRTAALAVLPGEQYELRVETRDGLVVRGRTRVPGEFALRSPALPPDGHPLCRLSPWTNLEVAWSTSRGAWSYLISAEIVGLPEALRREGFEVSVPETLELTGLAISEQDTTLVVPAQLGLFELSDLDQELMQLLRNGLPARVGVRMAVAAADRNLVNGIRGGAFNPSGNVRISSVVGDGVGVFGSLVVRELFLSVDEQARLPSCQ